MSEKQETLCSRAPLESQLEQAACLMREGNYREAAQAYECIVQLQPEPTALQWLGSLYALGLGVEQDFVKAACLFRQAERAGNKSAAMLCYKSMYDALDAHITELSPEALYEQMTRIVQLVFPEKDCEKQTDDELFFFAVFFYRQERVHEALKLFRACAEFCEDAEAQYNLGVLLYHGGDKNLPHDLQGSLYWLDRAADTGNVQARAKKEEVLNTMLISQGASNMMHSLLELHFRCLHGSENIPEDSIKARYWGDVVSDICSRI